MQILIFKQSSFRTIFALSTTVSFLIFHYYLYSPRLKIKIPNGYIGEVTLVLSNVRKNILTVDSNGIGYVNKWTFDKTYLKPIVEQMDGKIIDKNFVTVNRYAFWGKAKTCCVDGQEIESFSFVIVSNNINEREQYYSRDLLTLVDKSLVLFLEADK